MKPVFLAVVLLDAAACLGFVERELQAQSEAGEVLMRNYSPKEYKADVQTWAIVQDRRGVMYFGNNKGVLEYDGVNWRNILVSNRTTVRSLAIDSTGTIYVGAKGEFGYLAPDAFGLLHYVSLLDRVPAAYVEFSDVRKTYACDGGIYFQTDKMIFFWNPASQAMKVWTPQTVFHLSFVVDGRFYVHEKSIGLVTLIGDSLVLIPDGKRFAQMTVYAMLPWHDSTLLIATRERGLFVHDGLSAGRFPTQADVFLIRNHIYHGLALSHKRLALATLRGGAVFLDHDGSLLRILDKSSGLQDDFVLFLCTDTQEGLWLALGNGVTRVDLTSPITMFGERSGIKTYVQNAIRYQGRLHIATGHGVYRMEFSGDQGRSGVFRPMPGITTLSWGFLIVANALWVATTDGVYAIENGRASLIQKQGSSYCFYRSPWDTNYVYVGLRDGLGMLQYENGRWWDKGRVPGVSEEILSIAPASRAGMWLRTRFQGLLRVTRSGRGHEWTVERFGTTNGLPKGGINVFTVSGRSLFGGHTGLFRFDEGSHSFHPDSTFGDAFSDTSTSVGRMIEDIGGHVWIHSMKKDKTETLRAYRQANGSYTLERRSLQPFSDFDVRVIYPESDGVVWIGGPDGLIRFDSKIDKNYVTAFNALIRRVSIGTDSLIYGGYALPVSPQGGSLKEGSFAPLAYKFNSVRFELAATSFDHEISNEFQYLLEGFDPEWSVWTGETKKDYTNIPEGNYRFRVRARNAYGLISREDAIGFTVLPPWYRTWWAFALYIAALMLTSFGFSKWRSTALENDRRRLERVVADRTADLHAKNEQIAQQNDRLISLNQELKLLNDKKNEFLGIAAHDLRNPLNAIIGNLDVMLMDMEEHSFDPQVWKKDVPAMIKVARRMNDLINDLLDISAIESGNLNLNLHMENLSVILEECAKLHSRTAAQKNIRLTLEKSDDMPEVLVDKTRIAAVVDNLLSNAIKFTYSGGTIRVYFELRVGNVITNVQDSGQGLSDDDLKEIFMDFKQLSARPTAGEASTGLGLAIVKKIVKLHGGKIWVTSRKGQGSTFSFSLPTQSL